MSSTSSWIQGPSKQLIWPYINTYSIYKGNGPEDNKSSDLDKLIGEK
jgi:hypothetical protein